MTTRQWRAQPGDEEYEMMVKSLLLVLERANRFLELHPDYKGIFPGRKFGYNRKKNMRCNEPQPERK